MGNIITFYSFKGGVGRTMALANIATLLAIRGHKVLMVDWDLEAPGLEKYFAAYTETNLSSELGILDILFETQSAFPEAPKHTWSDAKQSIKFHEEYTLDLITAGQQGNAYRNKLIDFDLPSFFESHDGGDFIESLRDDWKLAYDFVLIDSRTGLTDSGGICTIQLPDILVPVFTANEQSVYGVKDIIIRSQAARQKLAYDRMPLTILPLPSRFDGRAENMESAKWLQIFADEMQEFYADWLPTNISPIEILERTKIPHIAFFSFGEKLAVISHGVTDPEGLGFKYDLSSKLIEGSFQSAQTLLYSKPDEADKKIRYSRSSFSKSTIVRLRDSVGSICSNPDCQVVTQGPSTEDNITSIGVAAHITAAAPNGPRYYPVLTSEQRNSYDNGIWLCQSCSRLIDVDVDKYTVELLKQWKKDAVERARARIGKALNKKSLHFTYSIGGIIAACTFVVILFVTSNTKSTGLKIIGDSGLIKDFNESSGTNNVLVGYTIEQHEKRLQIEKERLRGDLAKILDGEKQVAKLEKQLLENKISTIDNQLINLKESYQKRIYFLESTIKELRLIADGVDGNLLSEAEEQLRQGNSAKTTELFQQIEEESSEIVEQVAKAAFERGKIAKANLDYHAAYNHFERAVSYISNNPEYLRFAGEIASILAKHQQEIIWNKKALEIYLEKEGEDSPEVATSRNNLGKSYETIGKYQEAIDYYQRALASDLKGYGEDHPATARDRNSLGVAYQSLGQYEKAIDYYQKALASDLKTYGEAHPKVATRRNNLGFAYQSLGQYQKAITYYQQALASDLKTYGEAHPKVATRRNNLGFAYQSLGQYQKAIGYHQQALASDLKTYGEDHPTVAVSRDNLGKAYQDLGDYQKAIGYHQQALESDLQTYGANHPKVAIRYNNLGQVYYSLAQYEKASEYIQQALKIFEKTFGAEHLYVKNAMADLVIVQTKLKRLNP